jgi:hypothetical protein
VLADGGDWRRAMAGKIRQDMKRHQHGDRDKKDLDSRLRGNERNMVYRS